MSARAQQSLHNLTHHLCSSKIPALWVEGAVPAAAPSPEIPAHPCPVCRVRMVLSGPPCHILAGTRAGMGSSALVAAAGGRGAWSTAGHRSRTRKSALLMGRGLNQPNWVGVLSMELVLLLFILCLVNGKINKPPPLN